jgi:hypothetical protein
LYFTVHDSGVYNIEGGRRDPALGVQALEFIKGVMESPIAALDGFSIPVEAKLGTSWGELVGVDKYADTVAKAAV